MTKPLIVVPVFAAFSEQTHRFEAFVPVFGFFSEQISISPGIKTGSRGQSGSAASVTSRHRRNEIMPFCPQTWRNFTDFCRRSMDLEGGLRRFWLFLRFVPGFVRGPAALSEDFAPGPDTYNVLLISTILKASMKSPSLMSLNPAMLIPHSLPAATSLTSSLPIFSEPSSPV